MSPASDTQLTTFLCGHCGYDLRATSIGSPCPECGSLVESEPDFHAPFDHASYRIVIAYGWRVPVMALVALIVAPIACILLTHLVPRITALTFACSLIGISFGFLLVPRWRERITVHHRLHAGDPVCRTVRWGALVWVLLSLVVYFKLWSIPDDMPLMVILIATSLQVMLMFIVLERIARWMSVDGVVQCARFVQAACAALVLIWLILMVSQLVFIGTSSRGPSFVGEVLGFFALLVMGGVLVSFVTLLWLAKTAVFNILHYHENRGIEERRLERMRDECAGRSPRL